MDANRIIDLLTERIALLTKENVFLQARLEEAEKQLVQLQSQMIPKEGMKNQDGNGAVNHD